MFPRKDRSVRAIGPHISIVVGIYIWKRLHIEFRNENDHLVEVCGLREYISKIGCFTVKSVHSNSDTGVGGDFVR
jgi:hypothetical protein